MDEMWLGATQWYILVTHACRKKELHCERWQSGFEPSINIGMFSSFNNDQKVYKRWECCRRLWQDFRDWLHTFEQQHGKFWIVTCEVF